MTTRTMTSGSAATVEVKVDPDAARIERVKPAEGVALVDVMGGCTRHEIKVHDHGFVALIDAMPRLVPEGQTGDYSIVQAARVSYGAGTKKVNEDRGLIRYLLRHRHTSGGSGH